MISIEAPEDGGNPREPGAIQRLGEGHVRVFPFSEDGDGNYKFALHVRAQNPAVGGAPLTLEIDWADHKYMVSRNFTHLGQHGQWQLVPTQVHNSTSLLRCLLPPGESSIGLSPAYGWGDHQAFVTQTLATSFRRELVGRSEQGRAIDAYHLGDGPRTMLVISRVHPYETAASFCVEGLLRWLGNPGEAQTRILARFHLVVVPLPNPDGVYLGLCKRTGRRGADLSHEAVGSGHAEARALLDLIEQLRPDRYLDIHGWMHADEDGLHYHDQVVADRFIAAAAAQPALAGNRWKGALGRPDSRSPLSYCVQHFATQALSVSYRWPGRTVDQMRAIGAASLEAFADD